MDHERPTVSERTFLVFLSVQSRLTVVLGFFFTPKQFHLPCFHFAQPASCGNKEKLSEAEAWSSTPSLSCCVCAGWQSAVLFTPH